ncbi:T9SS type A sorting domain-containing protein [Bacteroidota bacterium]
MKKLIFIFCLFILTAIATYAQAQDNHTGRDTVIISNYQEFLVDTTIIYKSGPEQIEPTLAFDGNNYFVVWSDNRRKSFYHYEYDIYGAFINTSGVVTGVSGFLLLGVSPYSHSDHDPAISFDGNNYMLTWWSDKEIRCSRVNCSGIPFDTLGILLAEAGGEPEGIWSPEIIFSENKYFIIWEYLLGGHGYYNNISGCFIDTSGFVVKDSILISETDSISIFFQNSDLEFDGTNYLVVWEQLTNSWGSPNNICCTRVSSSGIVIDTSAIEIAVGFENESSPSIAFDGTNYLVVYEKGNDEFYDDIYGVRISTSGIILDPNAIPISTAPNEQRNPEVIYDGNNYIVVWQDKRSGTDYDIYGTVVKKSGEVKNSFPVSVQPGDQVTPSLTKGPGNQILVVYSGWTSTYNGNSYNTMRIWGAKMDVILVGVENNSPNVVTNYSLSQNYPNPFNPVTTIKYQIPKSSFVILKVYDVLGKEVATLLNEKQNAGSYEVEFDGKDYSSGIYFYKLVTEDYTNVKKMILLK